MLIHYLTLDLPLDASDKAIRQRYLERVKIHTPEADPVCFRQVTAAYEAIRDERRRIGAMLFGSLDHPDYESELFRLADARTPGRRRVGLKEIIAASKKQASPST